jgi:hypothetical protein
MNRKSQITIFVILAFILMISIIFIFVSHSNKKDNNIDKYSSVSDYIQDCLEVALENSLIISGLQGGYLYQEKKILITNYSIISYWYYTKDISPTMSELKNQISSYIEQYTVQCSNFSNFQYQIDFQEPKVNLNLENYQATASLRYQILIKDKDSSIKIDKEYKATEKTRLNLVYNYSKQMISLISSNPSQIPLSYIVNRFNQNSFNVTILDYNNNSIYLISDLDTEYDLNDHPYTFIFGVRR